MRQNVTAVGCQSLCDVVAYKLHISQPLKTYSYNLCRLLTGICCFYCPSETQLSSPQQDVTSSWALSDPHYNRKRSPLRLSPPCLHRRRRLNRSFALTRRPRRSFSSCLPSASLSACVSYSPTGWHEHSGHTEMMKGLVVRDRKEQGENRGRADREGPAGARGRAARGTRGARGRRDGTRQEA